MANEGNVGKKAKERMGKKMERARAQSRFI